MLADIATEQNGLIALAIAVVGLLNGALTAWVNYKSAKRHADSSAAIAAVHTNDVEPTAQNRAIAQAAVAALPLQPVVLPAIVAQDDLKTATPQPKV